MKRDEYGPLIEQYLTDNAPATANEITEAIGCSRQRVYTWLGQNKRRLRQVEVSANGAQAWELRAASNGKHTRDDGADGIHVGDTVTVRDMRLTKGVLTVDLVANDGTELTATKVLA